MDEKTKIDSSEKKLPQGENKEFNDLAENPGLSSNIPSKDKPKWYKNKKILLLLGFVIITGSALSWYYLSRNSEIVDVQRSTTKQTQPQTKPQAPKPYGLIYSTTVETLSQAVCGNAIDTVFLKGLQDGRSSEALEMKNNNYVSEFEVYGQKVLIVTAQGCGNKDGPIVWYSEDSGETYTKVFEQKPTAEDQWDQITSAKFSSDGSHAVIAYLPYNSDSNTVKEIDLAAKTATDLFTVDTSGVFIKGYDSDSNQILYTSGCYNCDGNREGILYRRDTSETDGAESIVFDISEGFTEQIVPSSELDKVLVLRCVFTDSSGQNSSLSVEEFDQASNEFSKLVDIGEYTPVTIGYAPQDGAAYYSKGGSVYFIDPDGEDTAQFTSSSQIYDVHVLSKENVIVSTGTFDNFRVIEYTVSSNSTSTLLEGDDSTNVIGVTRK